MLIKPIIIKKKCLDCIWAKFTFSKFTLGKEIHFLVLTILFLFAKRKKKKKKEKRKKKKKREASNNGVVT